MFCIFFNSTIASIEMHLFAKCLDTHFVRCPRIIRFKLEVYCLNQRTYVWRYVYIPLWFALVVKAYQNYACYEYVCKALKRWAEQIVHIKPWYIDRRRYRRILFFINTLMNQLSVLQSQYHRVSRFWILAACLQRIYLARKQCSGIKTSNRK